MNAKTSSCVMKVEFPPQIPEPNKKVCKVTFVVLTFYHFNIKITISCCTTNKPQIFYQFDIENNSNNFNLQISNQNNIYNHSLMPMGAVCKVYLVKMQIRLIQMLSFYLKTGLF